MSVIIKGMEMPKREEAVVSLTLFYDGSVYSGKNDDKYKAVELPPHGDLVEIDHIREVFRRNVVSANAFDCIFDHAPVIIPREEKT